jgi:hypothetical protein
VNHQHGESMLKTRHCDRRADVMDNTGTRISILWVVVMFNMVFADILSFIKPGALQERA